MGTPGSWAAAARRRVAATPGNSGNRAAGPAGAGEAKGSPAFGRLADRIEDNLGVLLVRAEEILRDNERHVLALAHALETHKTLSGEDVTAVMEAGHGPLVDGSSYTDDAFISKLRDYHLAAKRAHQQHNQPDLQLPVVQPAYAIADGFGGGSLFDGAYGAYGNGSGNGTGGGFETGNDDVIELGGLGSGNGSNGSGPNGSGSHGGPFGAPTYDPPGYESPDDEGTGQS
jgi:hypothetical protein